MALKFSAVTMLLIVLVLALCKLVISESKPNIVMVVIDDMGWNDAPWTTDEETEMDKAAPFMKQLATENAVILDSFYTSPTCTPSRASLLTGRYTLNIGLQDSVIHSTEPRALPLKHTLLPQRLGKEGYFNLGIGKWHLGFYKSDYLPENRGFDDFFGIYTGGGSHYSHKTTATFASRGTQYKSVTNSYAGKNLVHNQVPYLEDDESKHTTELYTDYANSFLSSARGKSGDPFFMYLAYQAVHAPLQVPREYYNGDIDNGCRDIYADSYQSNRRKLCGMINMLDDSMESLVSSLKAYGQWDNTILLVMSDNGGILRHGSSNGDLRGQKGEYFEGGVRVPAFVAGGYLESALAEKGQSAYRYTNIVHVTDLHATMLGLAGVDISSETSEIKLDGHNLWDAWTDGEDEMTLIREHLVHNINSEDWGSCGSIRVGDYKLMIECKVTESEIYTYGQSMLSDDLFDMEDLTSVITKKLLSKKNFYLFNIAKNPNEVDDGSCLDEDGDGDVEECTNLYDNSDFKATKKALGKKYSALMYDDEVAPSTELWDDDGPLTDPDLFNGFWMPWRDSYNIPYGQFQLVESSSHSFGSQSAAPSASTTEEKEASLPGSSSSEEGAKEDVDTEEGDENEESTSTSTMTTTTSLSAKKGTKTGTSTSTSTSTSTESESRSRAYLSTVKGHGTQGTKLRNRIHRHRNLQEQVQVEVEVEMQLKPQQQPYAALGAAAGAVSATVSGAELVWLGCVSFVCASLGAGLTFAVGLKWAQKGMKTISV